MVQRIVESRTVEETPRTVVADQPVEYVESEPLGERIVWFVTGILLVLLSFRFVLALLGANPANAFANFIYTVSHPFVAPFFSLFGYRLQYGVTRVEVYTLVAMAVYAVVAYFIGRLFHLTPRTRDRAYR
jgi:hypothetical protein